MGQEIESADQRSGDPRTNELAEKSEDVISSVDPSSR